MRGKQWIGIRRHGAGWEASVFVTGAGRLYEPFPLDTSPEDMQAWRSRTKAQLELKMHRRGPNRPAAGTFAADAAHYLRAVEAMPAFHMREADIALWVALFGTRRRDTIGADEIRTQRDAWLLRGPKLVQRKAVRDDRGRVVAKAHWEPIDHPLAPSTVNHRLRALSNLWTVLDGPSAYNPVREVPECGEGDGEPRGIPWAVASAILDAMPERRYQRKLTAAQADAIRALCTTDGANLSAIAREYGISETMVRKIRRGRGTGYEAAAVNKVRLRVIYWTGLAHKQLMRLRPKDVHLAAGTMYVERRKKGKGAAAHTRPLLPEAIEALTEFARLNLWGGFSTSALRASFLRACATLGLHGLRPYDFRHSLGTDIYATSKDIKAVQEGLGHADIRTSMRYMQAAVSPVVAAAMAKVAALRQPIAAAPQVIDTTGQGSE